MRRLTTASSRHSGGSSPANGSAGISRTVAAPSWAADSMSGGDSAPGQEPTHVDVAESIAGGCGEAGEATPAGDLARGFPRREDDHDAEEPEGEPGGLLHGDGPVDADEERQQQRPQRCGRVQHPGHVRPDRLLRDAEQQVRHGVGDQGRDEQVTPQPSLPRKAESPGQRDRGQDQEAEQEPGEHDLHRVEAAQRELDPEKAGTPQQRETGHPGDTRPGDLLALSPQRASRSSGRFRRLG